MKINIFKYIKEFGFKHSISSVFNYSLLKLTKKQIFREKLFKNTEKYILKNYKDCFVTNYNNDKFDKNFKIWLFWWQGINENSPDIIKSCINSIKQNMPNNEIVILNKDNLSNYLSLPDYILEKVKNKSITLTHLSDIIRVSLLSQYGGLWLDATIYITQDISDDLSETTFYTNKLPFNENLKMFVSRGKWSSFFMFSRKNNPLVLSLKNIFYEYWKSHNMLINYLFIDYAISTLYNNVEIIKDIIDSVPQNNENIYKLVDSLFDEYSEKEFNNLLNSSKIFKLTYKFSEEQTLKSNTNYQYIIKNNCKKG